jgi:hypothetical protein
VFAAKNNEAFVCTYRAARNMAFQSITEKSGEVTQLAEIDGTAMVGSKVKSPFGIHLRYTYYPWTTSSPPRFACLSSYTTMNNTLIE